MNKFCDSCGQFIEEQSFYKYDPTDDVFICEDCFHQEEELKKLEGYPQQDINS